jgi:hypothetical protein
MRSSTASTGILTLRPILQYAIRRSRILRRIVESDDDFEIFRFLRARGGLRGGETRAAQDRL